MGFVKSYGQTHLIVAPIKLKLVLLIKGGEVDILTKFQENLKNLNC